MERKLKSKWVNSVPVGVTNVALGIFETGEED